MSIERFLTMSQSLTPSDPYFKQTTLLLHADGTNGAQNNTFIDSSTNNFTITRNGNTTQGTFTPFSQAAGYWGNYFDGSSRFSVPANAAFAFGTGNFCIECWYYQTGTAGSFAALIGYATTGDTNGVQLYINGGTALRFGTYSTDLLSSSTFPTANAWNHIAVCRNGTTLSMFVNGARTATATDSTSITDGSTNPSIGYNQAGLGYITGYLSNLRVVKGSSVYDPTQSTLTVPTTPLTAITNTSLLTCQSNRFVDNSANNFTLTPSGTPSVQPFSPFAPTGAYNTTVNGGSGYFDGSGDWLEISSPTTAIVCSGDFTLEFWHYSPSGNSQYFAGQYNNQSAIAGEWLIYCNSDGAGTVYLNGDSTPRISVSAGGFKFNQWQHIALVRSGSTVTLYANGASLGTATKSDAFGRTGTPYKVGTYYTNSLFFTGYMTDYRLVKGTAVYTSAFTPPTAPLTAITNTQLLLSCTNAGIYDNAIKNDLETVGNAQISTSVKKYGTGSMAFDGNDDYLSIPYNTTLDPGTGDYTIECWLYLSSTPADDYTIIFAMIGNSRYTYLLRVNTSRSVIYSTADANTSGGVYTTYATSSALSLSTWYHIAVVKNGSTITLYINGTSAGSGTAATTFTGQPFSIGGAAGAPTRSVPGYIDDLRITKGIARYTANFTPPTSAFPNQ